MEGILNALNNEHILTVIVFAWGLLVKYHPAFAAWPNKFIPYLNVALALLARVAVPDAHAAGGALAGAGGFMAGVLASVWTSTKASLLYEIFARAHLNLPVPRQP